MTWMITFSLIVEIQWSLFFISQTNDQKIMKMNIYTEIELQKICHNEFIVKYESMNDFFFQSLLL
jgi:hypothetical protein